jgi:hypothetical protein
VGLIEGDRHGPWIYYRVVPLALVAASEALVAGPGVGVIERSGRAALSAIGHPRA